MDYKIENSYKKLKWIKFLLIIISGSILTFCSPNEEKEEEELPVPKLTTAETAMVDYLENDDETYSWEKKSSYNILGVTAYDLKLTSQKWREHIWTHQLTILVPSSVQHDGALLWITGGDNKDGEPKWAGQDNGETLVASIIALKNNAIVALLRQTPNQPFFDNLYEDALISYTLNQFNIDGDFSWPLMFPMTKSAIKSMDAIQEFSEQDLQKDITRFVVVGASKRGWTTWLTGAHDSRVEAIAPAVIDILNMPVNLNYQLETWGNYSPQIQDYVDLGIPQTVNTPQGDDIVTMIDPYSYREKLTMPKLIILGTNDPYWPVDAIKNYLSEIPGENYIHYQPNGGHDLGGKNGGEKALIAISAFWGNTLSQTSYPSLSWDFNETSGSVSISVQGSANDIIKTYLWTADSDDRDFRDEVWTSKELSFSVSGLVDTQINFPANGFKAFYIDLEYPDASGGKYTKSTRVFVVDNDELL